VNFFIIHHKINKNEYLCILYDELVMTKNTMGTKLPRKLEQKMQIVGEQIKQARLRRNLSVAQVAERATCSPLTVSRIEKGAPTVSIGIYLRVLYALQLEEDILWLAKEDKMGKALQDLSLKTRERASKKE
jgi:DNA-binding XRE family transcriptional regulator